MKKCLAVILALVLLCPFVMAGAGASATEEELKAKGRALMAETAGILGCETFTVTGRSSNMAAPFGGGTSEMTPFKMVCSNGAFAMEHEMDWTAAAQSPILGFVLRVLLGKRTRLLVLPEEFLIVFPSRRLYLDMGALAGEEANMEMPELFPGMAVLEIEAAAEVMLNGKNSLRLTMNQGELFYFYQEDQLKRCEVYADGALASVIEFDSIRSGADQGCFSTKWMLPIPMTLFVRILSLLG